MAKVLFVKPEDVKRMTIIDGSVDVNLLKQHMHIAQDIHIQNYLGTDLYNRIEAGVIASNLNANETILLNDYVQDAMIHFSAAEYLGFAPYSVKQGGVFKHISENDQSADVDEVDKLAQKEMDRAEYYTKRLTDYLCYNKSLYPEYSTNTEADIRPDNEVNYTGGFYLGS